MQREKSQGVTSNNSHIKAGALKAYTVGVTEPEVNYMWIPSLSVPNNCSITFIFGSGYSMHN